MQRNGESIYGTTASPFGELPWGYCTAKGNKLYLFVRDWPKDGVLTLPGLNNVITSASLLHDKSLKLKVEQGEKEAGISLPSTQPDKPVTVLVLDLDGPPKIDPPVVLQDKYGSFEMNYLKANTFGKTMTRFNRKGGFHISKWTQPEDSVNWVVNVDKPGTFQVSINYAAKKEWEGKAFEIKIATSTYSKSVVYTGDWFDFHKFPVGYLEISKPGSYLVTVRPKESGNDYLMWLNSVIITRVDKFKKEGWGGNEKMRK